MNVTLSETGRAKLDELRKFPAKLREIVARGLSRGAQIALGKTQKERFTGKGPFPSADHRIGIVTGRLRGSLLLATPKVEASEVTLLVSTAVKYFPRHEFGFSGTENVKAHTRKITRRNGKIVRNSTKQKKTPLLVTSVQVKAHTRKVNTPERRMLRTGLAEHLPGNLSAEIEREILRAK